MRRKHKIENQEIFALKPRLHNMRAPFSKQARKAAIRVAIERARERRSA